MKKNIINVPLLLTLLSTFSGCQVIGDIFKTGVGVGIFIVLFIIIIIVIIVGKAKGN